MKISNKEKYRILELHQKRPMKPWLFEQEDPIKTYTWDSGNSSSNNQPPGVVATPFYSVNTTYPNLMTPEQLETIIRLAEEKREKLHNFFDDVAFWTGMIPFPITQYVSVGADIVNVLLYLDEGKNREAGLYIVLAATTWGAYELITRPLFKSFMKATGKATVKNIIKNLENRTLKELTPNELNLLKEIIDNQDEIYKNLSDYGKRQAERYLQNPEGYKKAYNFMLKKDLLKFKWGSPTATSFYKQMARDGFFMGNQFLFQQNLDYVVTDETKNIYNFTFLDKLKKMGYDIDNITNQLFIDPNNLDDIKRLEKLWNNTTLVSYDYLTKKRVKGWRPTYNDDYGLENLEEFNICDYLGSLFAETDPENPCVKILDTKNLESKNIKLPYEYLKSGTQYYYRGKFCVDKDTGQKKDCDWYKLSDKPNIEFLDKQVFPQFK